MFTLRKQIPKTSRHAGVQDRGGAEITLGMAVAGGEVVEKCVNDPAFMAKENWAGELAARVYKAMRAEGQDSVSGSRASATAHASIPSAIS